MTTIKTTTPHTIHTFGENKHIINGKVYVRNWRCNKHNTFGDDPMIPCSYCGYSGRGRVKVFESMDDYKKYLEKKR